MQLLYFTKGWVNNNPVLKKYFTTKLAWYSVVSAMAARMMYLQENSVFVTEHFSHLESSTMVYDKDCLNYQIVRVSQTVIVSF